MPPKGHKRRTTVRNKTIDSVKSIINESQQEAQWKQLQNLQQLHSRYQSNHLSEGDLVNVVIKHIESPSEFYVAERDKIDNWLEFHTKFQKAYGPKTENIYKPLRRNLCAIINDNVWYRGKIIDVTVENETAIVKLIDFGQNVAVNFANIRMLDEQHAMVAHKVTQCKLIELNSMRIMDNANIIERFQEICRNSRQHQIAIKEVKQNFCEVYLYINQLQDSVTRTGTALILSDQYAIFYIDEFHNVQYENNGNNVETNSFNWTNNKELELTEFRSESMTFVDIVHINSTAELYICPVEQTQKYRKLHFKLQNVIRNIRSTSPLRKARFWHAGDKCIVYTNTSASSYRNQSDMPRTELNMWYRAKIVSIKTFQHVELHLLDIGATIIASMAELIPMNSVLAEIPPRVVRCHLAGISDWTTPFTTNLLLRLCKRFPRFAITHNNCYNDSLAIMLRGIKYSYENAGLRKIISQWYNINSNVMIGALIDFTDEFIDNRKEDGDHVNVSTEGEPDDWDENNLTVGLIYGEYFDGENFDDFHAQPDEMVYRYDGAINDVHEWLPAIRNILTIFTATPTHVDSKCIIYAQHSYNRYVARRMKTVLQQRVALMSADDVILEWQKNQPCLAKFHADDHFYRAIVKKVNKDNFTCTVKFVDYGNTQICKFEDMRKADILGHIPIQSNRYCITGAQPLLRSSKKRWTVNVTDFIHYQIVDDLCSFRVENVELVHRNVVPCAITVKGSDLKSLLVENEMVKSVKF